MAVHAVGTGARGQSVGIYQGAVKFRRAITGRTERETKESATEVSAVG